jgi:hypothetical protein
MDKKLKAKWLKALKSGQYGKATTRLCVRAGEITYHNKVAQIDRFCCLGVLCEITKTPYQANDQWPIKAQHESGDGPAEFLGLSPNIQRTLAALNDGDANGQKGSPKTFAPVIKWIEKNL